jgi:chromosome segregation ATPase
MSSLNIGDTPIDIKFLLETLTLKDKKCNSLQNKINQLESTLTQSNHFHSTRINNLEIENKDYIQQIKELNHNNDLLLLDNQNLEANVKKLEHTLSSKLLQLEFLNSKYITLKNTLNDTINRNHTYISKLNDLEEQINQSHQHYTNIINKYKSSLKLNHKPKLTK